GFARAFLALICAEFRTDLDELEPLVQRRARAADFEPATWALALLGRAMPATEYAGAVRLLQRTGRRVAPFFERYDVLLTPTVSEPPVVTGALQPTPRERRLLTLLGRIGLGQPLRWAGALDQMAEKVFGFIPWTPVANATGQPAMSVPLCWNRDGLPIGMHFMGRYGDEATLFRLARQLEEARPWFDRVPALARG
ncbi:MAG TPA: amidase family protein, partial [Gemmatimonadales bacterium]|nr:amidase family protein [Gemmatimonadales bacterium]